MSRPFVPRSHHPSQQYRINGKIRAREVRVIGPSNQQLGVFSLSDAINLARSQGVDLVEIAPTATPPVCRMVDFGKFRYEQAKRDKESKKHQHANRVKEIQLSPSIDPHDFGVKLSHAIDFLCEDMKVKVALRFRGREMAHKEYGFQVVSRFIKELAPFAHPDSEPKLIGRGINVMLSPLPRTKRAKHPHELEPGKAPPVEPSSNEELGQPLIEPVDGSIAAAPAQPAADPKGFLNNPFTQLDVKPGQ